MIKILLLSLVKFVHNLIILFVVLGSFLPKKYLIYFLFAWPTIFIHWQTNSNKCVLTELEFWIENKPYPANTIDTDPAYPFIRKITGKMFDSFSDNQLHKFILGLFTLLWVIGLIRYLI